MISHTTTTTTTMMILIYVQGIPQYSKPPEGYRDVLSYGFSIQYLALKRAKNAGDQKDTLQSKPGSLIPRCRSTMVDLRKHFKQQFACDQKALWLWPSRTGGMDNQRQHTVKDSSFLCLLSHYIYCRVNESWHLLCSCYTAFWVVVGTWNPSNGRLRWPAA
jgi:hypothetical protein